MTSKQSFLFFLELCFDFPMVEKYTLFLQNPLKSMGDTKKFKKGRLTAIKSIIFKRNQISFDLCQKGQLIIIQEFQIV